MPGIASGALNATRQSGSVIGVALYGALIANKEQLASGTHAALGISAALLVIGLVAVVRYVDVGASQGS